MNHPFFKRWWPQSFRHSSPVIDPHGCRPLALSFDGDIILEPSDSLSSIVFSSTGGGKTTRVAMTAIAALLTNRDRNIIINDVKLEIAPQIAEMCQHYGWNFGVIDDAWAMGEDYPFRLRLNPISPIVEAAKRGDPMLPLMIDGFLHTCIPEPKSNDGGQDKNFYWRESPRGYAATALRKLLDYKHLSTPGGLSDLLGDDEMFEAAMRLLAEDGEGPLKGRARQILTSKQHNPELFSQHIMGAQTALRIFAEGPLHSAGNEPEISHEQILSAENSDGPWVICITNPLQYIEQLGTSVALQFNSFMDVQLSGLARRTDFILDEFCAGPFKPAISRIHVQRAFKSRLLLIAQSREQSIDTYGREFTAILEENCYIKQLLRVDNPEEAERWSKILGQSRVVSANLGSNSKDLTLQSTFSHGKERNFTAQQLMSLPPNEQIIFVSGLGGIHCQTLAQNQIAPMAYDVADNPREGGRLLPDVKVTFKAMNGGA